MFQFGSGTAFATPQSDAYGNAITNPTVTEFGILQNISIDFGFDVKELFGRQQFPVDIARGKGKITGKASSARLNGTLLNNVLFGQAVTAGTLTAVSTANTPTTVPASTPFTTVITPPNAGVFKAGMGVTDAFGVPLTRVASAPSAGQFSLDESTGTHTFASTDSGKSVFINYQYTATVTSAKQSVVQNLDMGNAPTFSLTVHTQYKGKILSLTLHRCVSSKISLASKQDDYTIPDFEFQAFADDLGRVVTWSISE